MATQNSKIVFVVQSFALLRIATKVVITLSHSHKAIAKSKCNIIAIAFKIKKERQKMLCDCWKREQPRKEAKT